MDWTKRAGSAAASVGGVVLATAARAGALRPAAKPLHPRGTVCRGRLTRHGSVVGSGVPWIDLPGDEEVLVRLSRAIGLPEGWPDIQGMAVRVPTESGPGDLLFASTGWGPVGRFVLTAGTTPRSRPFTTLLPYRAPVGPVLLGAYPLGVGRFGLWWARAAGPWKPFGQLAVAEPLTRGTEADEPVSFDPIRRPVPGLTQYPVVVRLREPAYVQARRSRA